MTRLACWIGVNWSVPADVGNVSGAAASATAAVRVRAKANRVIERILYNQTGGGVLASVTPERYATNAAQALESSMSTSSGGQLKRIGSMELPAPEVV